MNLSDNSLFPLINDLLTRKKDYVFFLGAGFSKDAGVSSGWDILLETLKPLYILENDLTDESQVNTEIIEKWYIENPDYNKLGYSEILELVHKSELQRKGFLEDFFNKHDPGEAHKLVAQLVKLGFIKFIFTTNFDDLLEKALDELSIQYDVIYSDDNLKSCISWDRVKECRIYKLHGDYKKSKVKNTNIELSELEPAIAADFQYIIDRHGLVFIGYSGRDEGIMKHLLAREPDKYPLYWQYVSEPEDVEEYKYFHQLKNKYLTSPIPISYIANPSASKFLAEIADGMDNLERLTIVHDKNKMSYKNYILNQNDRKIRALSLGLIEKFVELHKFYFDEASKQREDIKKYELFSKLCKETAYIYEYLENLLTYKLLDEGEFIFICSIEKGSVNKSV